MSGPHGKWTIELGQSQRSLDSEARELKGLFEEEKKY